MTPLWQQVLELLAGLWTASQLAKGSEQGVTPQHAATGILELPTGYVTPQPPAGRDESRDLEDCHPELVRRYLLVKDDYQSQTGRCLVETCTWRSVKRQGELFAQGRTLPGQIVTKLDGANRKSRHNIYPSQAVDVCVDQDPGPGKHLSWHPQSYALLGPLCDKHGLVWGGSFRGFGEHGDYPHLELPAGVV